MFPLIRVITQMESPDEPKAHQRVERDKVGSWKVGSLDELQEELIESEKGMSLRWSRQEI
jgi:hypothetical protein